jgi:hypothetical protein
MSKIIRNITSQNKYSSKFDEDIYNEFKKIARENNRSINWFLNIKLKELKNDFKLKKYKEDENYKEKKIHLKQDLHQVVKRESYLNEITMRDYLQSAMEKVIDSKNQK